MEVFIHYNNKIGILRTLRLRVIKINSLSTEISSLIPQSYTLIKSNPLNYPITQFSFHPMCISNINQIRSQKIIMITKNGFNYSNPMSSKLGSHLVHRLQSSSYSSQLPPRLPRACISRRVSPKPPSPKSNSRRS